MLILFKKDFQKFQYWCYHVKLWTNYVDANLVLEDCFSRSSVLLIIWDFNSPSLWSTSRWFRMRKFSEGPALTIGPFQKIQREVIYFIYAARKSETRRRILSKNLNIHGEHREIFGSYNFWIPVKSIISDIWNWNQPLKTPEKLWFFNGYRFSDVFSGFTKTPVTYNGLTH